MIIFCEKNENQLILIVSFKFDDFNENFIIYKKVQMLYVTLSETISCRFSNV